VSSRNIPPVSTETDNDFSLLDSKIQYVRTLLHDGSEMSDSALRHGVYLSKISGREIIILHVLELIENIILDRTKEESSIMTDYL
jgi:hypothetical protein